MADDIKDAIEKNAKGPRRAKGDVGEVQQHSLKDQVEADRYLASRKACGNPHKALRFANLSPGAISRPSTARPAREGQPQGARSVPAWSNLSRFQPP